MEINRITEQILNSAYSIHTELGPGLLESAYEKILMRSLSKKSLDVQRQVPVNFVYDGIEFKDAFRMDLLVENKVIVEIKSVEENHPVHAKQLLTYLRLTDSKGRTADQFWPRILENRHQTNRSQIFGLVLWFHAEAQRAQCLCFTLR